MPHPSFTLVLSKAEDDYDPVPLSYRYGKKCGPYPRDDDPLMVYDLRCFDLLSNSRLRRTPSIIAHMRVQNSDPVSSWYVASLVTHFVLVLVRLD
jgi:hypothetical protein